MPTNLLPILVLPYPRQGEERVALSEHTILVFQLDPADGECDLICARCHFLTPNDQDAPMRFFTPMQRQETVESNRAQPGHAINGTERAQASARREISRANAEVDKFNMNISVLIRVPVNCDLARRG